MEDLKDVEGVSDDLEGGAGWVIGSEVSDNVEDERVVEEQGRRIGETLSKTMWKRRGWGEGRGGGVTRCQ